MISKQDIYKIGIFNKPHGVCGELLFTFTDDIFDRVDCDYLICLIDGIYVPFFLKEYRFKSDTTALVTLDDINTVEKAKMFTNVAVFFPKKFITEDKADHVSPEYFIGFEVIDSKLGKLGTIKDIDDSTPNLLFDVTDQSGKQFLIPVHEELIKDVDHIKKSITFDLPEGLLNMNNE